MEYFDILSTRLVFSNKIKNLRLTNDSYFSKLYFIHYTMSNNIRIESRAPKH